MTKLALHEKKHGKIDKARNSYFKWDYIYINNWNTRLAVGLAIAIIVSWLMFIDIYIKEVIPIIDIELGLYLSKFVAFFVVTLLVYTLISTNIYNNRYEETQKRLIEYERMLKELDLYQISKQSEEGELDDTNG